MASVTYEQLVQAIRQQKVPKIVLLMGDEPFFIDKLTTLFEQYTIPDDHKDFNQHVSYGNDIGYKDLIADALQFPMMSEAMLVLVKEAQMMDGIEQFAPYVDQVPDTTRLIISYKGKLNKRGKLYKALNEYGVVYEALKAPDYKVPDYISSLAHQRKMMIDLRSANMLADFLGNDLERIDSELEKLSITMQANDRVITPDTIQKYIGVSKEYNNFELLRAVVRRDASRAFRIAYHFARNEKNNPVQPTFSVLFNYFANLMALYYLPSADEKSIMEKLELRQSFQCKDYIEGMRNYKALKVYNIIRHIRMADAASKGVDSHAASGEILKELLCYILA